MLLVFAVACGSAKPAPAPVTNHAATTEPPPSIFDDREAVEDTAVIVRSLAYEAYPQWAVAHPDAQCPAALADLGAETKDRWGTDLLMFCGPSLPPGVKGFAVQSAGPDRKLDTADDVKSWESR